MEWILGVGSFVIFLCFQAQGIVGGDSGDLVTAAATGGVAHPPGYPLYTFLGLLTSRIPVFTPAWRVGLLSSLSHALTLVVVYAVVYSLTKKKLAALFASATLLGNYLFFLYGVTPEVFALLDLFVAGILYLMTRFIQTKKILYVYPGAFLFGLSLTHHHMILFLVPALIFVFWRQRKSLEAFKGRMTMIAKSALFFLLGFTPYLYIPIAAHGSSIINWDHAVNVTNFIRLVTRADYGTFVSSGAFGSSVVSRLLEIQAYGQYILMDFSYVGVLLIVIGCYHLYKTNRSVCISMVIAWLCLGPLFFFYASFPLVGRFTLGTYERFLLPSYVLLAVLAGVGFFAFGRGILTVLRRILAARKAHVVTMLISMILFVYPVTFAAITFWRFWGLPSDRTGDNLGVDILASVPRNGMLLLAGDTPLFTTQYVRYALGVRSDVVAIHVNLLLLSDYRGILKHAFPQIVIPKALDETFVSSFVTQNATRYLVFSFVQTTVPDGWYWVPHGLVYQLYSKEMLPSVSSMREDNEALWATYHNPRLGILSRYTHLLLSDIPNTYARARLNFGETMLRAGDTEAARKQFEAVIALNSDTQTAEAYTYMGVSYLFDKQCSKALDAFSHARTFFNVAPEVSLYEGMTYRDCVGDAVKAKALLDEYAKSAKSGQTPLEKL